MRLLFFAEVCAAFCVALAAVGFSGWVTGNTLLASWSPEWVTMKEVTCVQMGLCGLIVGFQALAFRFPRAHLWRIVTAFVFLQSATLFGVTYQALTGYDLGWTQLFSVTEDPALLSVGPGIPSIGTLAGGGAVVLFAVISSIVSFRGVGIKWMIVGFVSVLCGSALAGYALEMEALYYYSVGKSTAMALPTAICLACCCAGMAVLNTLEPRDGIGC